MSATRPLCARCAYWRRCHGATAGLRTALSARSTAARYLSESSRTFCSSRSTLLSSKRPLVTSATPTRSPTIETTPPPPRNANPAAVPGVNDLRPPAEHKEPASTAEPSPPPLRNVATAGAFKSPLATQEKDGRTQSPAATESGQASLPGASQAQQPSSATAKPRPKLRALRAAMTLTPAAVAHVKALLDQPEPKLLRVGTRRRGCSGLAYHLEYVDKPDKFDEVVKQDGIEILVESRALLTVLGTTMDWVDEKLGSRFVFNNPNIKEQCGCGESFMV